jgi:2,3-bisphosphoglycerate-independent phosphoglycerate mutase
MTLHILVLFFDGLGLGPNCPDTNPLVGARMPFLEALLEGHRLIADSAPFIGSKASLLAMDAQMGVSGVPQSATGQAALLTGRNLASELGQHYGPKPNPAITKAIHEKNLFLEVRRRGGSAALLNAYPPRYFEAIQRKHRLYSAIPMALTAAGLTLATAEDLQNGHALSPDFTGEGWTAQLDFPPIPTLSPHEAGARLALLARKTDLSWFDYWLGDYAGHRGTYQQIASLLEKFDSVLEGLVETWDLDRDLILLISDHGNLEDTSAHGHTRNPVPALMIGEAKARELFSHDLKDLSSFYHCVLRVLFESGHLNLGREPGHLP